MAGSDLVITIGGVPVTFPSGVGTVVWPYTPVVGTVRQGCTTFVSVNVDFHSQGAIAAGAGIINPGNIRCSASASSNGLGALTFGGLCPDPFPH